MIKKTLKYQNTTTKNTKNANKMLRIPKNTQKANMLKSK